MNSSVKTFLANWERFFENPSFETLNTVLDEDVIFYSPIIWTAQKGKALCSMYLMAASGALKNKFRYNKKIIDGNYLALEFSCEIEDIVIEGIDIISLNNEGMATEFKVMIRPYKAIEAVKANMLKMLGQIQN